MGRTLEINPSWGGTEKVELEISTYQNNGGLYIGLNDVGGEYQESYGDMTVNLDRKAPNYCAYVDINNMPELEKFIKENELGDFTGLTGRSGFCEYPLYLFDPGKLRALCPEGMADYEKSIGVDKKPDEKAKAR